MMHERGGSMLSLSSLASDHGNGFGSSNSLGGSGGVRGGRGAGTGAGAGGDGGGSAGGTTPSAGSASLSAAVESVVVELEAAVATASAAVEAAASLDMHMVNDGRGHGGDGGCWSTVVAACCWCFAPTSSPHTGMSAVAMKLKGRRGRARYTQLGGQQADDSMADDASMLHHTPAHGRDGDARRTASFASPLARSTIREGGGGARGARGAVVGQGAHDDDDADGPSVRNGPKSTDDAALARGAPALEPGSDGAQALVRD